MLGQLKNVLRESLVSLLNRLPDGTRLAIRERVHLQAPMDYPRHPITLAIESPVDYHLRTHSCAKEPETVEWLEGTLRPGDVIYDIGANVGAYSLVAAKFGGRSVRVFAFEPSFATFHQLCRNILLNDCQDNISPFFLAFAEETRLASFRYSSLASGTSSHGLVSKESGVNGHGGTIQMPLMAYRLDDWVRHFQAPLPTHLKLDVDGDESQILRGAGEVLQHAGLRAVLVEATEAQLQPLNDLLTNSGLRLQRAHEHIGSSVINYIYERPTGTGHWAPPPRSPFQLHTTST